MLIGIFSFGAAAGLFVSAWLKDNPHYADTAKVVIPGVEIPARARTPLIEDDLVDQKLDALPLPDPEMKSGKQQADVPAPAKEEKVPTREAPPSMIEKKQTQAESKPEELKPQEAKQEVKQETKQETAKQETKQDAAQETIKQEPAQETVRQEAAKQEPKPEEPPATTNVQQAKQEAPPPAPVVEVPVPSAAIAPPVTPPKAAKSRSKPKVAKKPQQDNEIERMKRQAGDELMKKTAGRNAAQREQKNAVNVSARPLNRRTLLVQCERAPNIFQRERCKWNLCNGMWGKNGCPSYEKPRELY